MRLINMKVNEFVNTLSSDAPAPGGGSASALAGTLGIALTEMVCGLTVGKKKYEQHQELIKQLAKEAAEIKENLQITIDKDTEAYDAVDAVFAMPKTTDEEKTQRSKAMQEALKKATAIPLDVMRLSLEALKITQKAVGKSNTNAASDLGVAGLLLGSALKGAGLNVLINIGGIKDEVFASNAKSEMESIIETGEKIANEIYSNIAGTI
ncbi:MAG: cyclodeaminase/cyclohydrolase family protein [Defluviitaleaceae bacterium]|nr:cyclodeaminase/cyclohydrolase family protein [Defluviitaleaceae bacterium]